MNAVRHDRQMDVYVGLQKTTVWARKMRSRQNKRKGGIIDVAAQRRNESIKKTCRPATHDEERRRKNQKKNGGGGIGAILREEIVFLVGEEFLLSGNLQDTENITASPIVRIRSSSLPILSRIDHDLAPMCGHTPRAFIRCGMRRRRRDYGDGGLLLLLLLFLLILFVQGITGDICMGPGSGSRVRGRAREGSARLVVRL